MSSSEEEDPSEEEDDAEYWATHFNPFAVNSKAKKEWTNALDYCIKGSFGTDGSDKCPASNTAAVAKFSKLFKKHRVHQLLDHNPDWNIGRVMSIAYKKVRRRYEYKNGTGLTKIARATRDAANRKDEKSPQKKKKTEKKKKAPPKNVTPGNDVHLRGH